MTQNRYLPFGEKPGITCDTCNLNKLCIPRGLNQEEIGSLSRIVRRNRTLSKGTVLYQFGEWHHGILALKSGTVKLVSLDRQGNEYIVDFLLPGDLLGFDGFSTQRHSCSAVALETVSYCELPIHQIQVLAREIPGLIQVLLQHSGAQFDLNVQRLMLSRRSAEERLASFLTHLSERYRQRGFSPAEFRFTMTRQEIGNYLGLAPETVSRLFSQFEASGLIEVQSKLIRILDRRGLQAYCPN
jgi:CRP/FNR family transcriptional regulator